MEKREVSSITPKRSERISELDEFNWLCDRTLSLRFMLRWFVKMPRPRLRHCTLICFLATIENFFTVAGIGSD